MVTLKNIDLSSITIVGTMINTLISIILAIIVLIFFIVIGGGSGLSFGASIIPALICGTIFLSIPHIFGRSFLYNIITSKINNISFELNDGEITKIEPISAGLVWGVISLICYIVLYSIGMLVVPMIASSFLQTLMMAGQTQIAIAIYSLISVLLTPSAILITVISSFIVPFVSVVIGVYCYNLISPKLGGIKLELNKTEKLTSIESIDPKSTSLILSVVSLILNVIFSVIVFIFNQSLSGGLIGIIASFVITFVLIFIISTIYNFIAKKYDTVKVEL